MRIKIKPENEDYSKRWKVVGFVTKFALTKGLMEVEGYEVGIKTRYLKQGRYGTLLKYGRDVFETREAAIEKAQEMAKKKIKALQKTIARLEKISREPEWYEGD